MKFALAILAGGLRIGTFSGCCARRYDESTVGQFALNLPPVDSRRFLVVPLVLIAAVMLLSLYVSYAFLRAVKD